MYTPASKPLEDVPIVAETTGTYPLTTDVAYVGFPTAPVCSKFILNPKVNFVLETAPDPITTPEPLPASSAFTGSIT